MAGLIAVRASGLLAEIGQQIPGKFRLLAIGETLFGGVRLSCFTVPAFPGVEHEGPANPEQTVTVGAMPDMAEEGGDRVAALSRQAFMGRMVHSFTIGE